MLRFRHTLKLGPREVAGIPQRNSARVIHKADFLKAILRAFRNRDAEAIAGIFHP
jgi:hypothetical protein